MKDDLTPPGYEALWMELDAALMQAATGKGKERHADDKPFTAQPVMKITNTVGAGFPAGQALKKIGEALGMADRGDYDAAVRELHGAIVYCAALAMYLRGGAQ